MTETLSRLLLRLSEAEHPVLWGRMAAPHVGRDFDRLLAQGVLAEDRAADTWSVCSDCDCGLDARPIQRIKGQQIAACPNDHRADVELSADDIRSFRIDPAMLMRLISSNSGLNKDPESILPGLWKLGTTVGGQAVFAALSVAASIQPGLMGALTRAARGSPIALLVPKGIPGEARRCLEDAGPHVAAALDNVGVSGQNPFAIDVSRLVPPIGHTPRLIIRESSGTTTLDGRSILLSGQPHRLLVMLAQSAATGNGVVSNRDIEDRTGRQARDIIRELRDGLAAGQPDADAIRDLIRNRRSPPAYWLALAPDEIDLRQ